MNEDKKCFPENAATPCQTQTIAHANFGKLASGLPLPVIARHTAAPAIAGRAVVPRHCEEASADVAIRFLHIQ